MSRTRIVKGKITEIIEKDYNMYSESNIVDNAAEIISDKGVAKGESYGNPKNPPPSTKLINTIVEFRTKQDGSYTGQFGFDWLRIDDNHFTTENAYYDCLENGYEAPNGTAPHRDSNTEYETKAEAFKALQKEYLQLPISRTATPSITKYYIPWLNLYPESVSAASTSTIKPPSIAELRVLVDVQNEEPDQIRIFFDKNNFTIDGKDGTDKNPVLITDKAIGAKRDTGQTITIKCIKEFPKRQELTVYGYPKDSLTKTTAEQLTLRKVVGKIVLEPNENTPKVGKAAAIKNRKDLNIVLIAVTTNIKGISAIGKFDSDAFTGEKESLSNGLYQSLIEGKMIEKDSTGNLHVVDVSANLAFQQKYNSAGAAIGSTHITIDDKIKVNAHSALKVLFNRQTHNKYINDLLVFSFNEPGDSFVGAAEDIGIKSLILVNTRNLKTLPHEALHCLGLYHTHKDASLIYLNNTTPSNSTTFNPNYPRNKDCIYIGTNKSLWMFNGTTYVSYVFHESMKPTKKFVYHHAHLAPLLATDNLMSYNGVLRKNTWHWQWKILKKNLI